MNLLKNLWITCFIILAGCAYHTGAPKAPFKTLYIRPATNKSFAPQFQALLTQQVAQIFLQEASISIVESEEAEATLVIQISDYSRGMAATKSSDTVLAQAMSLSINVNCSLMNNESDKPYFENREVASNVTVMVNDYYFTSEYQAMSELARSLAIKIKNTVISTW